MGTNRGEMHIWTDRPPLDRQTSTALLFDGREQPMGATPDEFVVIEQK
ncbi:MAG TPA: hypothetical protein VFF37_07320 [Streptomyces sp.]|nr:hypothetical protein [Streptomyces sp.]